jgi:hypothetical protein
LHGIDHIEIEAEMDAVDAISRSFDGHLDHAR